jgi:excisionase family DNA binding protein
MAGESHEWMTAKQVADLLGVSAETVRRYRRHDLLPANRLPSGHYRFRRKDAEQLLNEKQAES